MHKAWTRRSQKIYRLLVQLKDSIKPPTEVEVVKTQALDQSKREHIQNSISRPTECLTFSKIRLFLSLHKDHITHKGARFQTSEECLPNQFLQLANWSNKHLDITQSTPNNWKTKRQISATTEQCNKRWSTVSPLHLHKQHHPTIELNGLVANSWTKYWFGAHGKTFRSVLIDYQLYSLFNFVLYLTILQCTLQVSFGKGMFR